MAQVTAEQLLNRVTAQAGRIVQLELMNEALTVENVALEAKVAAAAAAGEAKEIKDVAAEISANGKDPGKTVKP